MSSLFLARSTPSDAIRAAVAQALGVAVDDVATLADERETKARVDVIQHSEGMATQVELYADDELDWSGVAAKLAAQLGEDVAYPDDDSADPYRWLVVNPSGVVEARSQSTIEHDGLILQKP